MSHQPQLPQPWRRLQAPGRVEAGKITQKDCQRPPAWEQQGRSGRSQSVTGCAQTGWQRLLRWQAPSPQGSQPGHPQTALQPACRPVAQRRRWPLQTQTAVGGGAPPNLLLLCGTAGSADRSPGASPAKGSFTAASPRRCAGAAGPGVGAAEPGSRSDRDPAELRSAAAPASWCVKLPYALQLVAGCDTAEEKTLPAWHSSITLRASSLINPSTSCFRALVTVCRASLLRA